MNGLIKDRITLLKIAFAVGIALLYFCSKDSTSYLYYPVFMNGLMSYLFISSMFRAETLIEKFARKREKNFTPEIQKYCFKLNIYWSILMLIITIISLYTAIKMDTNLWLLWNGLISYLIIGASIGGELVFRKIYKNRIAKSLVILLFLSSSNLMAQTCPPTPKSKKLIFTELRYIPALSEPMKVTGYLDIIDNENYTWETDGEYASKIEQRGVNTTFYKKEENEWIKTDTNKFLDIFLEINAAINGSNTTKNKKLKSECKIEKDGSWTLNLSPINEDLEIESIKIEGKENPIKFSMVMKNGFKSFVSYH